MIVLEASAAIDWLRTNRPCLHSQAMPSDPASSSNLSGPALSPPVNITEVLRGKSLNRLPLGTSHSRPATALSPSDC